MSDFVGRRRTPDEKMAAALKLAQEALDDEKLERKEVETQFEGLRRYANNMKAGIEVIVAMTMLEDTDDRSPEEVADAVIKQLQAPPH